MFDGMQRRVVSMWFPRLASDRALRACPTDAPFALTWHEGNSERLYCLDQRAESLGLHRGMALADARSYCPELVTRPAQPERDAAFLASLRRWAMRYCPWVGRDGNDGLILDVTGSTRLWESEAAMLEDMRRRMARAGLSPRLGCAATRGAAWALAHYGDGAAEFPDLPVAALRLQPETTLGLQRLGLRRIADLMGAARAPLARRFGPELLLRLDQALGHAPEPITPESDPPHFATRMTLPEPIGLLEDVMAVTGRLLEPLCAKLAAHGMGARRLLLSLRRVDQESREVTLRLAAPMREAARILPLFARDLARVDAGFGIDRIRLEATLVEPLPLRQLGTAAPDTRADGRAERRADLITRIGTRIGLEKVQRFLPAESHLPERCFRIVPATDSAPATSWPATKPRPIRIFPPEPVAASGPVPPQRFRWRRLSFTTLRATGPERITPEWWRPDENWRSGLRDYWRVETREGRRLWMFHTPQAPGWFVQGEFA